MDIVGELTGAGGGVGAGVGAGGDVVVGGGEVAGSVVSPTGCVFSTTVVFFETADTIPPNIRSPTMTPTTIRIVFLLFFGGLGGGAWGVTGG